MKIYIASSWKNQHGVEMLTALLRAKGHKVISWIENNNEESINMPTKDWLRTEMADKSFQFDITGATTCDLFILYTYAGNDAHAEMGAAWAKGIPIIGLWQKGYDEGLMSRMVKEWCDNYRDLLDLIDQKAVLFERINQPSEFLNQ
jgi:nucleoside 2-deoxyribosyltransferase